jgi:acyl-CoA synthetase (AMP-forming)/AMP-acid ligase II
LVGRYERLTFAELDAAANAAAAYLTTLGVREGDRVAACTANHTDIVTAFLAVQRLGAMWVGLNRNTAAGEKRFLISDAGVRIFLGDDLAAEQVRQLRDDLPGIAVVDMEPANEMSSWRVGVREHAGASPPSVTIDPWAPAAIAYTSGTTGYPKGVVHSQHNMLVAGWVANVNSGRLDADVVRATALPLSILNLMILGPVAAFSTGARHICMDRIDAEGVAEWIEAEQVNTLALVPTVVQDMLTLPTIGAGALRSITSISAGAATVPQTLPTLFEARFGQRLRVSYGLTECPTGVASTMENSSVQGAIGRPHFHLEVSIQDEAGEAVSPEGVGEICFRAIQKGPWAKVYAGPLGYWGNAEATADLLRGGWVHSGDIGSSNSAGELFIHDRRNDLILRGGANVYPAEVERVLRLDPRVRDVAVVGRPDSRLGEVVVAFVETFGPLDDAAFVRDLEALCRREIAAYKTPVSWTVLDALPRNAMGKVAKPALRERLREQAAT